MLGGTAGTLEASIPSFAAGTALWSAGLLAHQRSQNVRYLDAHRRPHRRHPLRHHFGKNLLGRTDPAHHQAAALFAYPFLVLTFIGWIWTILKKTD